MTLGEGNLANLARLADWKGGTDRLCDLFITLRKSSGEDVAEGAK